MKKKSLKVRDGAETDLDECLQAFEKFHFK